MERLRAVTVLLGFWATVIVTALTVIPNVPI